MGKNGGYVVQKGIPNVKKLITERANKGLYHGQAEVRKLWSSFAENKSVHLKKPQVFTKNLFSNILDTYLKLEVSCYALRMIDEAKGLDNYLLNTPKVVLKSKKGEEIKEKLKDRLSKRTLLIESLKKHWTL